MKERCGFTGAFPYWDWSIGECLCQNAQQVTTLMPVCPDAHDVKNSPLLRDHNPISGLGGWGDPSKDFQVRNGGFHHLEVVYPIPHIIRRNFTLQPFLPFASVPMFTNLTKYANESFTPEVVRDLLGWTPGDFVGFQASMEYPEVSARCVLGGPMLGS